MEVSHLLQPCGRLLRRGDCHGSGKNNSRKESRNATQCFQKGFNGTMCFNLVAWVR